MKATLILANGSIFSGTSIGSTETRVCEMVFNTSMTGYQEILTDPSYAGQGVVMSYPLIGNYGVNHEDNESRRPWVEAFVVRHLSPRGSNFRCEGDLGSYLKEHNITYDYINENPGQPDGTSGKIMADVYLDDRGICFRGRWDSWLVREILDFEPWQEQQKKEIEQLAAFNDTGNSIWERGCERRIKADL